MGVICISPERGCALPGSVCGEQDNGESEQNPGIPESSHVPGTGSGRGAPFRGRVENGCKGSGRFREG